MQSINKFIADNKNTFSTILAFLIWFYQPLHDYFTNQPFDWKTFIFLIFGGIVTYSIGKYPNGLVNSHKLTEIQKSDIEDKGYATSENLSTPVISTEHKN